MKQINYTLPLLFALITFLGLSQNLPDCDVLKNGTFKYLDVEDTSAYIVINGTEHTEYHNNGKYYIKSKLRWTNDCEFIMTMTEITIPDFTLHPGDKMKVEVIRIKGEIIYYNATVNDRKWPGRLKIISLTTRQA